MMETSGRSDLKSPAPLLSVNPYMDSLQPGFSEPLWSLEGLAQPSRNPHATLTLNKQDHPRPVNNKKTPVCSDAEALTSRGSDYRSS